MDLVIETTIQRDAADERGGVLKQAAGHHQSDVQQVFGGTYAEKPRELKMKMAN